MINDVKKGAKIKKWTKIKNKKKGAKIKKWTKIKNKKNNNIHFIHIPKTGGSFVKSVIKNTSISKSLKMHSKKKDNNNINFTVIRHPVDRFESYLNYRKKKLLKKYFKNNHNNHNNIQLNDIVAKMSDNDIINPGGAFRTITYYRKDVDIFITIDKLDKFFNFFDQNININDYNKVNVSKKTSGCLNKETRNRIKNILNKDMKLYNKLKRKNLI